MAAGFLHEIIMGKMVREGSSGQAGDLVMSGGCATKTYGAVGDVRSDRASRAHFLLADLALCSTGRGLCGTCDTVLSSYWSYRHRTSRTIDRPCYVSR